MFKEAAPVYFNALADFYALKPNGRVAPLGLGCALSGRHVLTAQHVLDQLPGGLKPVVAHKGRMAAFTTVISSPKHDLALVEMGEIIEQKKVDPAGPVTAKLSRETPLWGMSVGYFGRVRRSTPENQQNVNTCFMKAHLSFPVRDEAGSWALTPSFLESGFGGGPVFLPDGRLIGVITMLRELQGNTAGGSQVMLPIMSPVGSIVNAICEAVPDCA